MTYYSSSEEFYTVMQAVVNRLATESSADKLDRKMRLTIQVTDPAATFCINTRVFPPQATFGAACKGNDLGIKTSADAIHAMWTGRLGVRAALGQGKIQVQGNPLKALALKPLFDEAKGVYPTVLTEMGREP
ncbi:MAG: SCP2 sterol-binding domain-containing protein [Anaerolineae bacterium]|nr:SCP2 sterol-binding domain-containing protein [Anaerolineae bacterium]